MCYGGREKLFALHGDFVAKYERSYPSAGTYLHICTCVYGGNTSVYTTLALLTRCFIFLFFRGGSSDEYGSRMSCTKKKKKKRKEKSNEKKNSVFFFFYCGLNQAKDF